jgi:hypothetical protein
VVDSRHMTGAVGLYDVFKVMTGVDCTVTECWRPIWRSGDGGSKGVAVGGGLTWASCRGRWQRPRRRRAP